MHADVQFRGPGSGGVWERGETNEEEADRSGAGPVLPGVSAVHGPEPGGGERGAGGRLRPAADAGGGGTAQVDAADGAADPAGRSAAAGADGLRPGVRRGAAGEPGAAGVRRAGPLRCGRAEDHGQGNGDEAHRPGAGAGDAVGPFGSGGRGRHGAVFAGAENGG